MAEECHIVPVPAANDGPVVVLEVKSNGSLPLDVRLVGCEGEHPYVAMIKHSKIGKLKKNFKGTDHEWETVLSRFLLQKQAEGDDAKILEDVSMVYSIETDSLQLTVRRDVQGIKMTLGAIPLPKDEEFEINPFEWAQVSAQAHAAALKEVIQARASLNEQRVTVDKLKSQLDDFIKSKKETETAMLEQFKMLLNEKKLKIRDQQRLLASAKIQKSVASAVQSAREDSKPRKASASRTAKRKAKKEATPEPELESEHEAMAIDAQSEHGEREENVYEAATPDRTTDDETDSEGPTSSAPQLRSRSGAASTAVSQAPLDAQTRAEPPPRRELPFSTRRQTRANDPEPGTPPQAGDDDSETDDEEL